MTFIAKVIVYIKRLASQYFPVALLKRYISMYNIELSRSVALLRPVRLLKSTNSYKLYAVKLSYTRSRESFKECLLEIRVDHKLYGPHSLRSGGATSAGSYNPNLSEWVLVASRTVEVPYCERYVYSRRCF